METWAERVAALNSILGGDPPPTPYVQRTVEQIIFNITRYQCGSNTLSQVIRDIQFLMRDGGLGENNLLQEINQDLHPIRTTSPGRQRIY